MFTEEDGEFAVRTAREVIEAKVRNEPSPEIDYPEKFEEKMGAFVTINKYPSEELRGCIGYPEPIFKLNKALEKAAESATNDPRFRPLGEEELDSVIVEVSLLTPPEEVEFDDPSELPNMIECGRDGLVVSRGPAKGLLLPQVPVDQGWDEETFLSHTCLKAGLMQDTWREGGCTVKKFQGEVYKEEEPRGQVVKKELR